MKTLIKCKNLWLIETYSTCVRYQNIFYFIGFFSRATRVHLYRVWIGLLDTIEYDKETDTYRLKQLIIHEKYNAATYENDIALLELKGHGKGECSLKYSTPACIPWSEHMFKAGDKCKVSGWGLEKGIWFSAYYQNVLFLSIFFRQWSALVLKRLKSSARKAPARGWAQQTYAVGIWLSVLFFVLLPVLSQ